MLPVTNSISRIATILRVLFDERVASVRVLGTHMYVQYAYMTWMYTSMHMYAKERQVLRI